MSNSCNSDEPPSSQPTTVQLLQARERESPCMPCHADCAQKNGLRSTLRSTRFPSNETVHLLQTFTCCRRCCRIYSTRMNCHEAVCNFAFCILHFALAFIWATGTCQRWQARRSTVGRRLDGCALDALWKCL